MSFDGYAETFEHMSHSGGHPAARKLRLAMLVNGVDITGKPGGTVMAAHTDEDIDITVEAMRQSVCMLRARKAISRKCPGDKDSSQADSYRLERDPLEVRHKVVLNVRRTRLICCDDMFLVRRTTGQTLVISFDVGV